jgi:outer membrane lipoprotein-sorting protein
VAGLPEVIGLLHRADWTRLCLSAEVRFEQDGELTQAALLIAPGQRYRMEYGDEHAGRVDGDDGERRWTQEPPEPAPSSPPGLEAGQGPPVPGLLCPAWLLAGFTLDVREPVTARGRAAIAVTAVPRRGAIGSVTALRTQACDRIDLIVDAETGILLRREETSEGQVLTLTELVAVTMSPPEAADPDRFTPPAGSRIRPRDPESLGQAFSGPGWDAVKNAAGLAAGAVGAWARLAPHLPGRDPARDHHFEEGMPSADPAPLGPVDDLPSDDLLGLIYHSGLYAGEEPQVHEAVLRRWSDVAPMLAQVPDTARAAGLGGFGYLLDTVTRDGTVTLTTTRLRIGGPDRYRADFSGQPGWYGPTVVACDGEQRWQVYESATLVGPAMELMLDPMVNEAADLVGSSWLLGDRLSGGAEITYRGRRGYHLRVTRGDGDLPAGPAMFYPFDAIVDAETGCLLRLISYAGDVPATWFELDDITTEPGATADPEAFRPDIAPGTRVVPESGHPMADAAAVIPGPTGTAIRTASEAVRRTAGAVSAARSFLDDLRGAG